jgi:hypothetical protein
MSPARDSTSSKPAPLPQADDERWTRVPSLRWGSLRFQQLGPLVVQLAGHGIKVLEGTLRIAQPPANKRSSELLTL